MFKTIVIHSVGIGDWKSDATKKLCRSALFRKDVVIPFAPYPGLILNDKGWLPQSIKLVRFDVDQQQFVCQTPDDNRIPEKILEMEDAGKPRREITTWQLHELVKRMEFCTDVGWTLSDKQSQLLERWISTLHDSLK